MTISSFSSQMVSVEDDDLAGLEEVTSDGEDDNYEADLSDGETALPGAPVVRRPYRKRSRGEIWTLDLISHFN